MITIERDAEREGGYVIADRTNGGDIRFTPIPVRSSIKTTFGSVVVDIGAADIMKIVTEHVAALNRRQNA